MQDIVSVLDALCDKVGIAIDWSSENIAPQLEAFVARYGTYLAASSIFGLVLSVLFIAAGVTGIVLTYRSYQKGTWANGDGWSGKDITTLGIVIAAVSLFAIITATICVICIVHGLIQLAIVPEVVVANKILSMIG